MNALLIVVAMVAQSGCKCESSMCSYKAGCACVSTKKCICNDAPPAVQSVACTTCCKPAPVPTAQVLAPVPAPCYPRYVPVTQPYHYRRCGLIRGVGRILTLPFRALSGGCR